MIKRQNTNNAAKDGLLAFLRGSSKANLWEKAVKHQVKLKAKFFGVSKYTPHQSTQEKARRVRQLRLGIIRP